MQVVIDIPKDLYEKYINENNISDIQKYNMLSFIRKGTVLPKGHGNLFDENDFEKRVAIMTESMDLGYGEIMDIIDKIPTIIKANKRK